MCRSHVSVEVVLPRVDMARHGLAASVYFALVALALAVCGHVPGQIFLSRESALTSDEKTCKVLVMVLLVFSARWLVIDTYS